MIINKKHFLFSLFILIITLLVMNFTFYAIIGSFTRLASDEYGIWGGLPKKSIFETIENRYYNVNGRYTYAFVTKVLSMVRPETLHPIFTGIVIILYLFSAERFVKLFISDHIEKYKWVLSFMIASTIICSTFISAPNLFQVLYWKAGTVNYTFPIIIFLNYFHFVIQKGKREEGGDIYLLPAFIIPFLGGAFNEAFLAVQTSLLFVFAIITWYRKRNTILFRLYLSGLIGSIVSLIVIYFAPGTAKRQSLFYNEYKSIYIIVQKSFEYSIQFIHQNITEHKLLLLFILFFGITLAIYRIDNNPLEKSSLSRILLIIAVIGSIGLLLIIGTFATGIVGLGKEITGRTKINPQLIFISFSFILSYIIGIILRRFLQKENRCCLLLSLITFGVGFIVLSNELIDSYKQLPYLKVFAAEWDSRDLEIRNSKEPNVRVAPLSVNNFGGLNELRHFPEHWINKMAARYYGKNSIVVCDTHYPDICIPSVNSDRGDFDCIHIPQQNFTVIPPDPHGLDKDKNGIGCDE